MKIVAKQLETCYVQVLLHMIILFHSIKYRSVLNIIKIRKRCLSFAFDFQSHTFSQEFENKRYILTFLYIIYECIVIWKNMYIYTHILYIQ